MDEISLNPNGPIVRFDSRKRSNTVDELLNEINLGLGSPVESRRLSFDSDTGNSSAGEWGFTLNRFLPDVVKSGYTAAFLRTKECPDLLKMKNLIETQISKLNYVLLLQLKFRDRLMRRRSFKFDIVTATLQAMSPKRRVDTKMRFSVDPMPGDSGFTQWCAAMQMVSRLPGGIPVEFRKRLWLTLADRHVQSKRIDWKRTRQTCLNEKTNPDDDKLGVQIVKDLHRTGCSMFSGEETEHNQALLKKVLLAYARWNKVVGYCQGFNMLAAIILEVMEWQEENALKVMIYLIEEVLPEGYFANHMRGLSVDMAVFRELLRMRFPILSQHLDRLQMEAQDTGGAGTSYEPPLTNVFTMQWFLTLFSNCLPKVTVLQVWDLIFLEGNEVLLRTALSIWGCLADRVLTVESADEFYSIMGVLTREMLEFGIMDANDLIKTICTMTPLSLGELNDMRDKYAYNIRPLTSPFSSFKKNLKILYSDDEDECDDDNLAMATWCLSNTMQLPKSKGPMGFSDISPGAVSHGYGLGYQSPSSNNVDSERMSLDISALKKQYAKLRERQKQAHVILTGALANHSFSRQRLPIAVNHLLVGKKPLVRKNKPTSRIIFEFKSPTKPSASEFPGACTETSMAPKKQVNIPTTIEASGGTLSWAQAKLERQKLRAEKLNNNDKLSSDRTRHLSDSSSCSSSSTELCDDEDTPSISDFSPDINRKTDVKITTTATSDNESDSPDSSTFTASESQAQSTCISPGSTLISPGSTGTFQGESSQQFNSRDGNLSSPYDSSPETTSPPKSTSDISTANPRKLDMAEILNRLPLNDNGGRIDFLKLLDKKQDTLREEVEEVVPRKLSDHREDRIDFKKLLERSKSSGHEERRSDASKFLHLKLSPDEGGRIDFKKLLETNKMSEETSSNEPSTDYSTSSSILRRRSSQQTEQFDINKILARRASLQGEDRPDYSKLFERKTSSDVDFRSSEIDRKTSIPEEEFTKLDEKSNSPVDTNKTEFEISTILNRESYSVEDESCSPDNKDPLGNYELPKFDFSKYSSSTNKTESVPVTKLDVSKWLDRAEQSRKADKLLKSLAAKKNNLEDMRVHHSLDSDHDDNSQNSRSFNPFPTARKSSPSKVALHRSESLNKENSIKPKFDFQRR